MPTGKIILRVYIKLVILFYYAMSEASATPPNKTPKLDLMLDFIALPGKSVRIV